MAPVRSSAPAAALLEHMIRKVGRRFGEYFTVKAIRSCHDLFMLLGCSLFARVMKGRFCSPSIRTAHEGTSRVARCVEVPQRGASHFVAAGRWGRALFCF